MRCAFELLLFLFYFGLKGLDSVQMRRKDTIFDRQTCPAFLVFENIAFLADMTIELPCKCKPEDVQSVIWYYQRHLDSGDRRVLSEYKGKSAVDSTEVNHSTSLKKRISTRFFSLVIYMAQKADSGYYICGTKSKDFFYAYDVDIQKVHQVSLLSGSGIFTESSATARRPAQPAYYITFHRYHQWSKCDRCGVPGEQTRVGLCHLKSDYLLVRYRLMNSTVASCGTPAVSHRFQLDHSLSGAKLEVKDCQVPCPAEPTLPARQKPVVGFLGDLTRGTGVPVYYEKHPEGTHVILACPGAKSGHAVSWDQGQVKMLRKVFMKGLRKTMRVYIDGGSHLHFDTVLLQDKGSYYCWLQGELAAEIRLAIDPMDCQPSDPSAANYFGTIGKAYAALTSAFLLLLVKRSAQTYFRWWRRNRRKKNKN